MAKEKPNADSHRVGNTSIAKSKQKVTKSAIGAPSQRSQPSRKGKRTWRKNVDLDDVEEGLEEIRTQERVLGRDVT
ncbi:hypothetical protein MPER_05742, partial [Moniliophthora perniciosa FA553]